MIVRAEEMEWGNVEPSHESAFVPTVKTRCICTGQVGEYFYANPNCMFHGLRSRHVARAMDTVHARTAGSRHNGVRNND